MDDSLDDDSMSQFSVAALTYKDLVDHVNMIEGNYDVLQKHINHP
jgi:hypothetical protein